MAIEFKLCVIFGISVLLFGCTKELTQPSEAKGNDYIYIEICKNELLKNRRSINDKKFKISSSLPYSKVASKINVSSIAPLINESQEKDYYRVCYYFPKADLVLGGVGEFIINERLKTIVYEQHGK